MIRIYLGDDIDKSLVRRANNQLNEYLDFHFHPYDSLSDKASILQSDDIFEEFVFLEICPPHLYRQNKKKCIEKVLELREWIRDSSEHTLTPLHEYILCSALNVLKEYDEDTDGLLTRGSEENTEEEIEKKDDLEEEDTSWNLRDLHFYLENCFEDYDFYDAEDYFQYAINNPNFEQEANVDLTQYKELVTWDVVKEYEEVKELRFMLKSMMRDIVTLEKQNGEIYKNIKANIQKETIRILDTSLIIEEGDTITRLLSNGHMEEYIVMQSDCFGKRYGIPEHYELTVRKLTSMSNIDSPGSVHYNFVDHSVNTINGGSNNRFNKSSTDNSTNLVYTKSELTVFDELRNKFSEAQIDEVERTELLSQVDQLEESVDTPNFISRYQKFISSAADHMTLIGPLIPALTELIK